MKNEELFRSGSVWKALVMMGIPALISILVMFFYNVADMYFVGWLGDVSQVAAVSLVGPVFTILMAFSTMLGNGGCTVIAQAMGGGDQSRVRGCSSLCAWCALVCGLLFAVLCLVFCDPLLRFLGANQEMWPYAKSYLVVLALGAPIILLNYTIIGGIIRGEGAIKEGMIGNFLATIANIVLDPLFIITFKLGVTGAAIATVIGNGVGLAYFMWYKKHKTTALSFRLADAKSEWRSLGHILALGMPNAISSVLGGFASTFSNQLLVVYGTGAVAAMSASGKAVMVVSMVPMGLCMGVQPMMAYCYGAKNTQRLGEIVRKLSLLTLVFGLALGAGCFLGRDALIGLFIKDAVVAAMGAHMVTLLVLCTPFMGLFFLGVNFLQASGQAFSATLLSALRQGLLFIPLLYLMEALFKVEGIIYAHIVADSISILVAYGLALLYFKKLRKATLANPV